MLQQYGNGRWFNENRRANNKISQRIRACCPSFERRSGARLSVIKSFRLPNSVFRHPLPLTFPASHPFTFFLSPFTCLMLPSLTASRPPSIHSLLASFFLLFTIQALTPILFAFFSLKIFFQRISIALWEGPVWNDYHWRWFYWHCSSMPRQLSGYQ